MYRLLGVLYNFKTTKNRKKITFIDNGTKVFFSAFEDGIGEKQRLNEINECNYNGLSTLSWVRWELLKSNTEAIVIEPR